MSMEAKAEGTSKRGERAEWFHNLIQRPSAEMSRNQDGLQRG